MNAAFGLLMRPWASTEVDREDRAAAVAAAPARKVVVRLIIVVWSWKFEK